MYPVCGCHASRALRFIIIVPSCCHVSTHVMLGLNAEMAGLAPSEDTEPSERTMLHLNDEIAGLIEAADMPADKAGAHSTKPQPASSLAGKV